MKYLLVGLIAFLVSLGAFAKDDPVTIDGKNILVTDFSESGFGSSQVHSNDFKGGVYIIAGSVDQRFQNAEKAMAEMFKAHGIKVADTLETSSMAIVVNTMLALDIAKADQAAAYTSGPNAGQVIAGGGQMVGAVYNSLHAAAGGVGGLVGFAAGALFNTDSKLVISVTTAKNPKYTKGWAARGVRSTLDSGGDNSGVAKVFYKLEKGKEASDDIVLKMAIDQWIKHFVIFDTPTLEAASPAAPVAQAAPATSSIVSSSEATNEK